MSTDDPTLTIARLNRLLERAGSELPVPQYRVLGLLASGDERATKLASRLGVAKPTLTTLVDSLVDRGYVARETPADDRRTVRLSITPAGRGALQATRGQLRGALDDVLDHCRDRRATIAALDDLAHALDLLWSERLADPATADDGRPTARS